MSQIMIRDPFADFEALFGRAFDRSSVFAPRFGRPQPSVRRPLPINVYETEDGVGIEAWVPGFGENEIEVTVDDGTLEIRAERQTDHTEQTDAEGSGNAAGRRYRRRELSRAALSRRFRLDPSYDTERITARLSNGILELSLPKAEAAKPQQIEIAVDEPSAPAG